ncbi:U11/U12 small nuclear ribonucleoprotein 65 kDa protein isoform X4 [Camellia sinensis]|uniref:U11/U12 small nuclear ribonucleoprotein 65 kDa protein isoform X4 n=1 Tax=Camellia sinensis TaxID=4442 RepID=UPI001035C9FC|nr:U11/U12 small nuclear ribonucleoprotein 65 kDa protein isoform X4 [Camellia sinensis]
MNPQTTPPGYVAYQGVPTEQLSEESAAAASTTTTASTLLIRHLPEAIPSDTLSRLFSHYGASSVRPFSAGRVRNCAFVDFKSEALASQAHRQLNGYAYPPPDGNILTNIVLHLMNKMNIPAPFRMALPTPPLPTSVVVPTPPPPPPLPPPIATKPPTADLSSGESELESSDEEVDGKTHPIGVPQVARPKRKRIKREAIVGPAVDKYVAHEAVGLKPANLVPKEIPMIKKKNPVLQIKIMPKQVQSEQTEIDMEKESMEPDKENLDFRPYATPEELKSGKLPPEEILSLPMFKNYMAGNPASVLYVKNLAKDVVVDDFYFIFGSLFESIDAAKSSLSVKLMQEGRMRGQAFVTFPSIELAHHALNLVNGYVFKGKPMIIQFGRNTTTTAKTN